MGNGNGKREDGVGKEVCSGTSHMRMTLGLSINHSFQLAKERGGEGLHGCSFGPNVEGCSTIYEFEERRYRLD
jgi:hypothetical protein